MRRAALFLLLCGCTGAPPASALTPAPAATPGSLRQVVRCAPLEGTACRLSGSGERLVLRGVVLTADQVLIGGEVVIDGAAITGVGCGVSGDAPARSLVCPRGVISPGLINLHDHIFFNQKPPGQWGDERFDHRHQWRLGLEGHNQITDHQAGNDIQATWSELRHVLAGTTSLVGTSGRPGLARNLDDAALLEGLAITPVVESTFPLGTLNGEMPTESCDYPDGQAPRPGSPYLGHVAEGINDAAHNDFLCVTGGRPGAIDVTGENRGFVHGIATGAADAALMARTGTSLIWSPRSNISLYGDTAPATLHAMLGVNIALGTDWTQSGSMNLLRELACAQSLSRQRLDGFFRDRDLWQMVTGNAAAAIGYENVLGVLAPGAVADVTIFDLKSAAEPYGAVVSAGIENVVLVLRGGQPLYGNAEVIRDLGGTGRCENLDACGVAKALCLDTQSTFGELIGAKGDTYDLFACGTPTDEPTCEPSRAGYGRRTRIDPDGDGVPTPDDTCPRVFNPIRPMDHGEQADADGDGIGDACDPTPLPGE